ncbi:hypothetical protein [Cupriavidus sp. AcVe19-6a]|uniref:hypothetical protein n=1 Tax=Cupriavidus sp. AcVe19-6a TaxID=2821358 RepID=UPI001AE50DCA|nr:hypothetical protein [Cupriavidus sp. AcVe19-6a]MBP0634248.1 hypothetical protein [Cupriavidus sp. AcVe19-6a]
MPRRDARSVLPADLDPASEVGEVSPSPSIPLFYGYDAWYRHYLPALGHERAARRLLAPLLPRLIASGLAQDHGTRGGYRTERPLELAHEVRRLLAASDCNRTKRVVRAVLSDEATFVCRRCHRVRPIESRREDGRCADCAALPALSA